MGREAGVNPASQAPVRFVELAMHGHRTTRPPPETGDVAPWARGSSGGNLRWFPLSKRG